MVHGQRLSQAQQVIEDETALHSSNSLSSRLFPSINNRSFFSNIRLERLLKTFVVLCDNAIFTEKRNFSMENESKLRQEQVHLLREQNSEGSIARARTRHRFLFMPAILRHDGTPSCFYGHPSGHVVQPSFSSACRYESPAVSSSKLVFARREEFRRDSRPLFSG